MKILRKIFSITISYDFRYIVVTILWVRIKIRGILLGGGGGWYRQYYERKMYREFKNCVNKMRHISNYLKPQTRDECFDRYFIEDYVNDSAQYIKGDVLEFAGGETIYAQKYGTKPNVFIMAALSHKEVYPNANYYADLENEDTLPSKKFDCIVATQVIMYMEDLTRTLNNLKSMLKPNGYLILTVPGPIFHHSKNSHHMFSFTEESIKSLLLKTFGNYENFECYGNLEYVQYMLFWIKKNPYHRDIKLEYQYTLVMGITAQNK